MADVDSLQRQIETLKFQMQIANPNSAEAQQIKQQIQALQQQLDFAKVRQGSNS